MSVQNYILKDLYKDYFKVGAACAPITERFTNNEIGNPEKEALLLSQFNSMTCDNALKPMYNMGFADKEAREDYLPFVIDPLAKQMLEFAKERGIFMRGHVLVWHSQCPKEAFCKGYKPVTIPTDPKLLEENPHLKHFEKLDPVCFVDRETMLKRMESYIFSLMEYMYKNGYAETLYAWDVVNEAIELEDKTPTGLRNSYWYQVIGEDFMYWAFKYAKAAVKEMSEKYASLYGLDIPDKSIIPSLFYNDYNEQQPEKKKAIIDALLRETSEHGSIIGDGLIDGIGMQGHISDNNNVEEYIAALKDYAKYVSEIHITELDVKCTCTNKNAFYYQAVFYNELFAELVKAKKEGINLTSVTLWGLTDDNSWIRGANPLLFNADLSAKKAFDALVYVHTGESLGEPEIIKVDLSDRVFDFEPKAGSDELVNAEEYGFKLRGFSRFEVVDKFAHSGRYCIALEKRFDNWTAIGIDVSDFIGQTIDVSAWVKCPASEVVITADTPNHDRVAAVDSSSDEWVEVKGRYSIPSDVHSMFLYFEPVETVKDKFSPIYIDDVSIKLIGLVEGFENDTNIASIRGAGHLAMLSVTDKEARFEGGHSLLVARHEKDATVKFNISSYIGNKVRFSAFVKTKDSEIRMGLDSAPSIEYIKLATSSDEWNEISCEFELAESLKTAEIYLETDGASDYYIDDIFVEML